MFFVWNALVNIAWFIISGIVSKLFLDARYQAKDLYDSIFSSLFLFPHLSFSLSQSLSPLIIFFSKIDEARVSVGVGFFVLFLVVGEQHHSP